MSSLDIIWNVSLICPWDCEFCCTDAVQVKRRDSKIIYRENSLSSTTDVKVDNALLDFFLKEYNRIPDFYDQALYFRQKEGKELKLEQKIQILENLKGNNVSIDFAGGDPLACYENYIILKKAAEIYGKDNISITSTGLINKKYDLSDVAKYIGEYEFTYDEPEGDFICRPKGYNSVNLEIASKFSSMGVKTKAQLPLHNSNFGLKNIEKIVKNLADRNIDELLLMRTFPVGRAFGSTKYLDKNTIQENVKLYFNFAEKYNISIRLQCALKHLFDNSNFLNPCDLMRESFGVNFQGKLMVSAWANNSNGYPINDDFVLGDLTNSHFFDIEKTRKFLSYKNKLDENFGHCKIFSYLFNKSANNGLFEKTDPLYK
ncbi:hypothetical protein [Acinetobacter modestus]|uniref:hypothetical protein n=1 Tax=Acinetobacter modestus TaxID=1776740 RepID=UPI00320A3280